MSREEIDAYLRQFPPIFIIGAARSGTKFLRRVVNESPAVTMVPYDIPFIWRYGITSRTDDCFGGQSPPREAVQWIRRAVIESVGGLRNCDGRRIVEKTVGNTLRVGYVNSVFPNAQFLSVVRDGRDVVVSSMTEWRARPSLSYLLGKARCLTPRTVPYAVWWFKKNFKSLALPRAEAKCWGPRYPGMEEDLAARNLLRVCAKQWLFSVELAAADLKKIEKRHVLDLRYESLGDINVIRNVFESLKLPVGEAGVEKVLKEWRKSGGKWRKGLTLEEQAELMSIIGPQMRELGYE